MNIPGTNNDISPLITGNADGLIALLHSDDVNHTVASSEVAQKLVTQKAEVLFLLTAIIQAATTSGDDSTI